MYTCSILSECVHVLGVVNYISLAISREPDIMVHFAVWCTLWNNIIVLVYVGQQQYQQKAASHWHQMQCLHSVAHGQLLVPFTRPEWFTCTSAHEYSTLPHDKLFGDMPF